MSQNPGHQDPYNQDPNAPQQDGGYQSAPSYDAAGHAPAGAVAKPQPVSLAEKLMYAGGALSILSAILSFAVGGTDAVRTQIEEQLEAAGMSASSAEVDAAMQAGLITGLVSSVIIAGIWFLLGYFNGKGKGWARIIATILGVINVLTTVLALVGTSMLPGAATGGALNLILSVVGALLAAAIVFLLWKKESTAYFKATR